MQSKSKMQYVQKVSILRREKTIGIAHHHLSGLLGSFNFFFAISEKNETIINKNWNFERLWKKFWGMTILHDFVLFLSWIAFYGVKPSKCAQFEKGKWPTWFCVKQLCRRYNEDLATKKRRYSEGLVLIRKRFGYNSGYKGRFRRPVTNPKRKLHLCVFARWFCSF